MALGVETQTEAEKVEAWLLKQFSDLKDSAGDTLPYETAARLAREGADVHRFEELLKAGCPAGTAAAIVDRFVDGHTLMRP